MTPEESQRQEDRKRALLLLAALIGLAEATLDDLAVQLARGAITVDQFGSLMLTELADLHGRAARIGRVYAGIGLPKMGSLDSLMGNIAVADEGEFLSAFLGEIKDGKYNMPGPEAASPTVLNDKKISKRAQLYAKKLRGTANEAWMLIQPENARVNWRTNPRLEHCHASAGLLGCVDIERGNPWTPKTVPTVPGGCETTCLFNCGCELEIDGILSL